MKVGVLMLAGPRHWVGLAQAAEGAGFDAVWFPEHLVFPVQMSGKPGSKDGKPPIPPETPVWDTFVLMAYLAGQTTTIRFGTNVFNVGLRHPIITARALTTLDVVSGGRVDLGLGASWLAEEWQAMQLPFEGRGARVDEAIEVMQRLMTEDAIEHTGAHYSFQPVRFEPKPVQKPWPPLIIGGDAPAALRRAARLGDGWIPMYQTPETLPEKVKEIQSMRRDLGRTGPFQIVVPAGPLQDLDGLKRWRDAGVDRTMVAPWTRASEGAEQMKRYADEVLARLD